MVSGAVTTKLSTLTASIAKAHSGRQIGLARSIPENAAASAMQQSQCSLSGRHIITYPHATRSSAARKIVVERRRSYKQFGIT